MEEYYQGLLDGMILNALSVEGRDGTEYEIARLPERVLVGYQQWDFLDEAELFKVWYESFDDDGCSQAVIEGKENWKYFVWEACR
jgi:hypothetical protein